MRVTSRKVTRYYVWGKGYATKQQAYREIAKHELRMKLSELEDALRNQYLRAHDLTPRDLTQAAWSELWDRMRIEALNLMFPRTCERSNKGIGLTTFWHGKRPGVPGVYWCNGCKWDWIIARAKELQAEDEGKTTDRTLALPARKNAI
jgi:hypothetical protein